MNEINERAAEIRAEQQRQNDAKAAAAEAAAVESQARERIAASRRAEVRRLCQQFHQWAASIRGLGYTISQANIRGWVVGSSVSYTAYMGDGRGGDSIEHFLVVTPSGAIYSAKRNPYKGGSWLGRKYIVNRAPNLGEFDPGKIREKIAEYVAKVGRSWPYKD